MYLSRIHLDVRNVNARKCMTDCQSMHRSILKMFHCSRQMGDVLYRWDAGRSVVYIQSQNPPDAQAVPAGVQLDGTRDIAELEGRIEAGRRYPFDLLAVPAKKVAMEGTKNSRRRLLRTPGERMDWLRRKGEQHGFELIHAVEAEQVSSYGKHAKENGGSMHVASVRFQGLLRVTDKERFRNAWRHGIGPGRAYGNGMLLLRGL